MAGKFGKKKASGLRPGGEDQRATNVPVGENQPPVWGNPETATGLDTNHCGACGKFLDKKIRKHSQTRELLEFFQQEPRSSTRTPPDFEFVCHACWLRFYKKSREKENVSVSTESLDNHYIKLDIGRATCSQKTCVFGCRTGRHRVLESTRVQVAKDFRFYIPSEARVCDNHNKCRWSEVPRTASNIFTANQVTDMFDMLRNYISDQKHYTVNFDYFDDLEESVVNHWTGLNKEKFSELLNQLPSLHAIEKRHTECALAIYLAKLKTGHTDQQMADVFVNGNCSTAIRLIKNAREALDKDFTPNHVSFLNLSREQLLNMRTVMSYRLLLQEAIPALITIWDGTYIYTQKSSNNAFQRACYSMHKHRHLIKPMVIVAPNGNILDVDGPFKATENDATIMRKVMQSMPEFINKFEKGDYFILDRGFRDVVDYLESEEFKVAMPEFIPPGQTQLSDMAANRSRFVTKIRFVVEVINGHFKYCFKYFNEVWQIQSLDHLMTDFRNAAALHNAFYSTIVSDLKHTDGIAKLMIDRLETPNLLCRLVNENNLNRKTVGFVSLTEHNIEGFPILTKDDLYRISLGTYQIRQAKSYYDEHVDKNGRFTIEVSRNLTAENFSDYNIIARDPLLLRARIQSRHSNHTRYYVYIVVERNGEGSTAIKQYYCSCKTRCRTVGCCTHVMTILWYLGYAQHLDEINVPTSTKSDIFLVLDGSEYENVCDDE